MPGVIMENGGSNGSHTNHDRDSIMGGTNGSVYMSEPATEKMKLRPEPPLPGAHASVNGINGGHKTSGQLEAQKPIQSIPKDAIDLYSQLPPEITHITEGYFSLGAFIGRLAQQSSNRLSSKIMELAAMPTPNSAINGNSTHHGNGADDNSVDNINKKVALLKWAESTHADWTKALVVTQWSRISESMTKLIDVNFYMGEQRRQFAYAENNMAGVAESFGAARMPNPDLRTAVEVLTTGKVSWLPDHGYIQPPPLKAKELQSSLKDLDTLLSIRLNLHEHAKLPYFFRDYAIKSGRVTFKVAGEFEVDLTIADENPATQFWFIDFRLLFSPAPPDLLEVTRFNIESGVNAVLETEGLMGCYRFLHELVLTQKIGELRRQAFDMSRTRWIDTLVVEPLHRSLSIQYWVDRYGKDGPKSWIILGVHSGKRKDAPPDSKTTSRISVRWFRDSKEVKDVDISINLTDLSLESLLQSIIGKHVNYILWSTYEKLRTQPLYASKALSLIFQKPSRERTEPSLKVQLSGKERISVSIEPITGRFAFSPASRLASQAEWKLNSQMKDPAANAHEFIENLRCITISETVISRALSVGWQPVRNPGVKQEELKPVMPRHTLQLSWFKRPGWSPDWYIALSSTMSGERWWLLELSSVPGPDGLKIKSHFQIPSKSTMLSPSHDLLSGLHYFAASMITHYTNLRDLHARRAAYMVKPPVANSLISPICVPVVYVRLSHILPSKNKLRRTGKPWAKDLLKLSFKGLRTVRPKKGASIHDEQALVAAKPDAPEELAVIVAKAVITEKMPPGFSFEKRVDKDIAFHQHSGSFAFRLEGQVGEPMLTALLERLKRVEQLVDFVQVVKSHEKTLHCETVSLGKVIFTYGHPSPSGNEMVVDIATSQYRAIIDFAALNQLLTLTLSPGNPHLRIIDHLSRILNSPVGLDGVATFLPLTLPVCRALSNIEETWSSCPSLDGKADVMVLTRAVDWFVVRYTLFPSPTEQNPDPMPRRINLDIRLQHRNSVPWWCVRREKDRSVPPAMQGPDEIDESLKTVWSSNGPEGRWRGMQSAGIAQGNTVGVEELILSLDQVMREAVEKGVQPWMPQVPGQTHGQAQTQLPTPAQSQAQSQGASQSQTGNKNSEKHDMIVID